MTDRTPTPLTDVLRPLLGAHADVTASHVLASDWFAHVVAAARADERERITAAVEAVLRRVDHPARVKFVHDLLANIRAALAQPGPATCLDCTRTEVRHLGKWNRDYVLTPCEAHR